MLGNIRGVNQGFSPTKASAMSDLKTRFDQAVTKSKQLPEKPDNATLLKIYALYKQATAGDVEGKRPGFTDIVGRAKYDAWAEVKGTPTDAAMQSYIDLIDSLG
jgi:diazepam-binding inhibitor (GABA receptor modulating acyl-CoA-binding protein)